MLSGDEASRRSKATEAGSSTRAGSRGQSPNVAEKAAAHMAALLPDFRPKETVNEFLSEVKYIVVVETPQKSNTQQGNQDAWPTSCCLLHANWLPSL